MGLIGREPSTSREALIPRNRKVQVEAEDRLPGGSAGDFLWLQASQIPFKNVSPAWYQRLFVFSSG